MKKLFFILLLFVLSSCAGTYYTVQTSSYNKHKCYVYKYYHNYGYKYHYKPLHKPIHKPIHRKYIRKHRK